MEDSDDEQEEEEEEAPVNLDSLLPASRTVKSGCGGADLRALSEQASALAPRLAPQAATSPSSSPHKAGLEEQQAAGVDWLAALHASGLPAVVADDPGLGRKAMLATFLARLPRDQGSGAALLVCPVSSLAAWQQEVAVHAPALAVLLYTGAPAHRRRLREELVLAHPALVITSYRTLFLDSSWFLSRTWSLLIQAEAQNITSAGSADQLRALVRLRAKQQRILLVSGQQKANPIDLWHTVYLLFPGAMRQREGMEGGVEVESTQEYHSTVTRLQAFLSTFTLSRSR